jgi:hypothetical protein
MSLSLSLSLSLFHLAASFYEYQSQKESKTARSSFTETVQRASRVFCGRFFLRLSVEQLALGKKILWGPFGLLGVEKKKLARKTRIARRRKREINVRPFFTASSRKEPVFDASEALFRAGFTPRRGFCSRVSDFRVLLERLFLPVVRETATATTERREEEKVDFDVVVLVVRAGVRDYHVFIFSLES